MRKLLLFLLCMLSLATWSDPIIRPRIVSINGTYTTTQTLRPFVGNHNLHALAISGSITLNSDTSLVRVIMHDVDGKSYLMYEASPMLINGYTDTLTNANEETEWMCGVVPYDLKIVVKDATCNVSALTATQYNTTQHTLRAPAQRDSIRIRQVQAKVDKINAYNEAHGKLWSAGITYLATLSHSKKKSSIGTGCDDYDSQCFEYYSGGIYDVTINSVTPTIPPIDIDVTVSTDTIAPFAKEFVASFDWRNRHGINWNTPLKHQYESGFCYAFAGAATLESAVNLFYNDTINWDLSEKDIAFYCHNDEHELYEDGWNGGKLSDVAKYIALQGVCFEHDMPFPINPDSAYVYMNQPSFRPSTYPVTRASNFESLFGRQYVRQWGAPYPQEFIDSIKSALINRGPLIGGISTHKEKGIHHALELVGYILVQNVDSISLLESMGFTGNVSTIPSFLEKYSNEDIWIFKNSYGENDGHGHNGYMYIVFDDYYAMETPYYIGYPIIPPQGMEPELKITDNDGDGYYTWGTEKTKPQNLPSWVSERQDGDDTNPAAGPIDRYGFLEDLTYSSEDTIYINQDTTIREFMYLKHPLYVGNNSTLTIACQMRCSGNGQVFIEDGSNVIINNGELQNITIIGNDNSLLALRKKSHLNILRSQNNIVNLRRTH